MPAWVAGIKGEREKARRLIFTIPSCSSAEAQGSFPDLARAVYSAGQSRKTIMVEATALTSVVAEPIFESAAERSWGIPKM